MNKTHYFFEKDDVRKPHDAIWQAFRQLKGPYEALHAEWIQFGRHYNHRHWNRSLGTASAMDSAPNPGGANRIVLNITKNIIDTIHSRIVKHQPDLCVLAEQNDTQAEAQSDFAEKFLRERFRTLGMDEKQMECFLHACIYGTGVMKFFFNENAEAQTTDGVKRIGELECKVKLPYEVFVDHEMLGNNEPNWILELEWAHIKDLQARHPKVNFDMDIGKSDFPNRMNAQGRVSEFVPVLHLYHRKTNYMKKGRYVLCTRSQTLEDTDYESKYLPFVFMNYSKSPSAFWGVGIGKQLRSLQLEINKILYHVSQNQNLLGRPKMFLPNGGNIVGADQNGISVVTGTMEPKWLVFNPTPPEVREHLAFLIEKSYETVGMSQSMATGEPPPAVRSAIAMEHMAERENDRFALLLINYEQTKVELAQRMLYEARRNYKKDDQRWFKAVVDSKSYEKLEFDKLNLEEENYHINIQTESSLGHTKAGRLDFLLNLVQMGLIKDPAQIMDLMKIPNEDRTFDSVIQDVSQAREENLRMTNGEEIEPSEFEDQQAHIKEHITDIKTKKFTKEPADVKKRKSDHLHKHFALMQAQQQQQQQQAQQAQMTAQGQKAVETNQQKQANEQIQQQTPQGAPGNSKP